MEPAGLSISTSASADALRRASTFCWAAAGRGEEAQGGGQAKGQDGLARHLHLLGPIQANDALKRVQLLLVRRREQVGERAVAGILASAARTWARASSIILRFASSTARVSGASVSFWASIAAMRSAVARA